MTISILLWLIILVAARTLLVASLQQLCRSKFAEKRRIYAIPIREIQLKRERYMPFIGATMDAAIAAVLIATDIFHFTQTSWYELLCYVLAHVFIVEPVYYWYHRLLHIGNFYKKHHYIHHLSAVPQPATSFTFTLVERLSYTALFAIPLLVAAYFQVLSFVGFTVYVLVFDFLNSLGHFNFEIFPKKFSQKYLWFLIYTPSFHAQHHSKFNYNFSLFMPIFDYIFKTKEPTTEAAFKRIKQSRPFTKISEKA